MEEDHMLESTTAAKKIFAKDSYRPLPKCLTIRDNNIDGLGLFATEDIPGAVYLGETHFIIDAAEDWLRTPLGGFINHSEVSNASIELLDNNLRGLTTKRNILEGEEITVTYTLY